MLVIGRRAVGPFRQQRQLQPVVLGADDAIAGEVEEDVLELRIEVTKVRAKREAVDRRRRDLGLNALDRRIGRVRGQLDRTEHGIGPRDVALELRIFVDAARGIEVKAAIEKRSEELWVEKEGVRSWRTRW